LLLTQVTRVAGVDGYKEVTEDIDRSLEEWGIETVNLSDADVAELQRKSGMELPRGMNTVLGQSK